MIQRGKTAHGLFGESLKCRDSMTLEKTLGVSILETLYHRTFRWNRYGLRKS